jgi:hypothetical protein
MSQEDMEGFIEKKPPQMPKVGDKVILPTSAMASTEAEVVELRGPYVIAELPNGEKMLGKFGSCKIADVQHDSVWFYNKIDDEKKA